MARRRSRGEIAAYSSRRMSSANCLISGVVNVVSAAPRIALAAGYDVDAAFEASDALGR